MKVKVLGQNSDTEVVPVMTKEKLAYRNMCEAFKVGFSMGIVHAERVLGRSVNG